MLICLVCMPIRELFVGTGRALNPVHRQALGTWKTVERIFWLDRTGEAQRVIVRVGPKVEKSREVNSYLWPTRIIFG